MVKIMPMTRLSLLVLCAMVLSGCTRMYCIRVGGTDEHPEWADHWLCGPANESFIWEVTFGEKLKQKTSKMGRVRLTYSPFFPWKTPTVKDVANEYNDGTPIKP